MNVEHIPAEDVDMLPCGADWQSRHLESEKRKAEIRDRIHKQAEQGQKTAKDYFRPAKPTPSIYDSDLKRVAVYARVSTSSEEQISSIENQTLYYTKKIAETENWNLQDIYSDEGKSGTSLRKRDAFKRMMRDAKDQKMDLIICASISRFARNFSDCMTQIAALKTMHPAHPIGVYFETENIYTLNPSSQYSLDIQALLADWESGNKSRRMILSYDQRIMTGQYPVADLMGYRHTKDGQLVIEPEEAKTVRFIFLAFIQGYDYEQIAMILTQKKRSTLRGRQEWNGMMVANIMKNERRWGDLEARKSIVVDYKLGKVTKNNGNRCSAYVPEHHEAIVSPEIARAAHLVASSSKKCGVQDIVVIRQGALKGFVGVHPNWNGINAESIRSLCLSTYLPEEVAKLNKMAEMRSGKKLDMALPSDYLTVPGTCFINRSSPVMTISKNGIRFSKACHSRLDDCEYVELLYHPILQVVILRKSNHGFSTTMRWRDDNDVHSAFSARAFSGLVFQTLNWKRNCRYQCRGICQERENAKFLLFELDESRILIGKNHYEQADGYSMNLECRLYRHKWVQGITARDVMEFGQVVENPMIGAIPSRNEVQRELDDLFDVDVGGTYRMEEKSRAQELSVREISLIRELAQIRKEHKRELEYEKFDGYELPPRTQFSMLNKPAVSIKYGVMKFNMACIRLFEGIKYVLPILHPNKKRLALIMCPEEDSASVEWARQKDENWVNKDITSLEFVENIFRLMNWNRECRYKVLGRVANSDQGLCMLFDLEEAIMFTPKPQEYTDPLTGEMKKKQMKFFPDTYRNRIGKSYNDYIADHQMNMFEDFIGYQGSAVLDEPVREEDSFSKESMSQESEISENILLPDLAKQSESIEQQSGEIAERGMPT